MVENEKRPLESEMMDDYSYFNERNQICYPEIEIDGSSYSKAASVVSNQA